MRILGYFCLLVAICYALEFDKRISRLVLMNCVSLYKFLTQSDRESEGKGGFLLFGYFSQSLNVLGLFLMFGLGLMFVQFTWQGKGLFQFLLDLGGYSKNGLCSKNGLDEVCDEKVMSCMCGAMELLEGDKFRDEDNCEEKEGGIESCIEDEVLDVMMLRKLVKSERQRGDKAYAELEMEKMAAASSAEEAMAMILRLQSEMSATKIESNQYRRLTEQKQELDREVIQSLQWIIMKHESERSTLEDKLRLCREKLKECMKRDKRDAFEDFDGNPRFLDPIGENFVEDVPN